jgi:hypothetical protein
VANSTPIRPAAPLPDTESSVSTIHLALDDHWRTRSRLERASLVGTVAVTAGYVWFLLVTPFNTVVAILAPFFVLVYWTYDRSWSLSLRFARAKEPSIAADQVGLHGEVFPLTRFKPFGSLFVVRSILFRRCIAVVSDKNTIPWNRASIRLAWSSGGVSVAFPDLGSRLRTGRNQPPAAENSILAGVSCMIRNVDLLPFFLLASAGGADVHVRWDVLTQEGLDARERCLEHDPYRGPPTRWFMKIRTPKSPAEAATWFRPPSAN